MSDEPRSRVDKLAQQLLDDRAKQAEREQDRQRERQQDRGSGWRDSIGFDPYQVTNWKTIAGPDPGYMPKTPMRMGPVGFYVHCQGCNAEFESKGWAYCPTCMELPAEERHAMKPAFSGRMCQAPRCENPIPRTARKGAKYCSKACRQRASYSTDKPAHED
jgi:hypothetical protein